MMMIEKNAEDLPPAEIEYIARQVRLSIAENLTALRTLQQQDSRVAMGNVASPNTGIYTQSYQTIELLRTLAHGVAQIALAAINRKPPLRVRRAEINGTLHQVAHHFYGDYRRAEELLRLNPHIRQPNFITQEELLNAYSK